jgi:hypothetical protein
MLNERAVTNTMEIKSDPTAALEKDKRTPVEDTKSSRKKVKFFLLLEFNMTESE